MAPPEKRKVLVVDDDPRRRLVVVSTLARRFDVHPLPAGEDALRAARTRRPDLVLFAFERKNADEIMRMCRTLRTDVRPIECVAVYTSGRAIRPFEQVGDLWRADGYLAGEITTSTIDPFVDQVLAGERPAPRQSDAGVLGRILGRLRG